MNYPKFEKFHIKMENATFEKIKGFGVLADGWHYGNGGPASNDSINSACKVCENYIISRFPSTDAFFGEGGDISVTAYFKNHYIETTIKTNGKYDFLYEVSDRESLYLEDVSEQKAVVALREIKARIWPGSDLSILATMIQGRALSIASHSKTLLIIEAPRSYQSPAFVRVDHRSASTLVDITVREQQAPLQYFGRYQNKNFRLAIQ